MRVLLSFALTCSRPHCGSFSYLHPVIVDDIALVTLPWILYLSL